MDSIDLFDIFKLIDSCLPIPDHIAENLISDLSELPEFQLAAVAAQANFSRNKSLYKNVLNSLLIAKPNIGKWLSFISKDDGEFSYEASLLRQVDQGVFIEEEDWRPLIDSLVNESVDKSFLAILLSLIKTKGLAADGTKTLTMAMWRSGVTYDYRNLAELNFKKSVRRYPTGALSEKIALIMPSLLMAFSERYPIVSPFTIGRSLSFTGGTWDKLSSIRGFKFPEQGEETISMLSKCGISMTVTSGYYNPADDFLYPFRSLTNTVRSQELIVSSIASKQLAVPADTLLVDVRYGDGAFILDMIQASSVATEICAVLEEHGIHCESVFTEADQPTGSAIGNYCEVLEAVIIMGGENYLSSYVNPVGLLEQRRLVIDMTIQLLTATFSSEQAELEEIASGFFNNGKVLSCFKKLLSCHGVDQSTIKMLLNSQKPDHYLESFIYSTNEGSLQYIDQEKIGNLVNFRLGGCQNQFFKTGEQLHGGFVLTKRLGETVERNELLATIFHTADLDLALLDPQLYFFVG